MRKGKFMKAQGTQRGMAATRENFYWTQINTDNSSIIDHPGNLPNGRGHAKHVMVAHLVGIEIFFTEFKESDVSSTARHGRNQTVGYQGVSAFQKSPPAPL